MRCVPEGLSVAKTAGQAGCAAQITFDVHSSRKTRPSDANAIVPQHTIGLVETELAGNYTNRLCGPSPVGARAVHSWVRGHRLVRFVERFKGPQAASTASPASNHRADPTLSRPLSCRHFSVSPPRRTCSNHAGNGTLV